MHTIRAFLVGPVVLSLLLTACIGDPWRSVNKRNTLADYRRYVNEYPDSRNRTKAEEHIAFLELEREPTLDGYADFRANYPNSTLAESLRADLEPKAFARARFAGTAAAYQQFMDLYPDSAYTERARGNQVYVAAGGFGSDRQRLEEFARTYPQSDYAVEALKSFEALKLKSERQFEQVGLTIRVAPDTPEAARVIGAFTDRAVRQYKSAGQTLVRVPDANPDVSNPNLPRARLLIEHKEAPGTSKLVDGNFTRPGMTAVTRVTLYPEVGGEPVLQRVFTLRLDREKYFEGTSLLFNPNALPYWESFFVPVASWPNRAVLRKTLPSDRKIVAVDSAGDRTVTLFENGEFRLVELANPEAVFPLAEYRRPKDYTRWQGVKILGKRILIYGEDGIEMVGTSKSGLQRVGGLERQSIGAIVAVVPLGKEVLLASSRGLLITDLNATNARRLMRTPVKGLDRVQDSIVFTDGESAFVSSIALLAEQGVLERVELGYEFGPSRVIGLNKAAVVLGKTGAVVIDLSTPSQPKVVSRLDRNRVGSIDDVVAVAGRVFLVGDRGLQLLDPSLRRVVESVDIGPRKHAARMGRFLVTTGDEGLQVVDSVPLTVAVRPRGPGSEAAAPQH